MRGNGWLVLTDDELRFKQWIPAREDRIPLAAITEVSTPRVWLGKTVGRKLLCVRWRTPDGGDDAMAWEVRDVERVALPSTMTGSCRAIQSGEAVPAFVVVALSTSRVSPAHKLPGGNTRWQLEP